MGLDVIATDEISSRQDMKAICEAIRSGVKVIATSHGDASGNLPQAINQAVRDKTFDIIIYLEKSIGNIQKIYFTKGETNVYENCINC